MKMFRKFLSIFKESSGIHRNVLLQKDRKHYTACLISSTAAGFSSDEVSPSGWLK